MRAGKRAAAGATPQGRLAELEKTAYAGDFSQWCRDFLPHYFPLDVPDFRKPTIDLLNTPGLGKRIAVAEPRAHGKSTTYALAYPLYAIAEGHHIFTVIFSSTGTNAQIVIQNIRSEIERNDKLREAYPVLAPLMDRKRQTVAWTNRDLVFRSGQRISARGVGSSVRGLNHMGNRPDLLILDDTETDETNVYEYQRLKYAQYVQNSIFNLGGSKGCDIFVVGTILHQESFLSRLVGPDEFPQFHKSLHRAVLDWHNGTTLWPEAWSFEKLMAKQAEIGQASFAQEYQQTPASMLSRVFREEGLRYYPRDLLTSGKAAGWPRIAYVDPAMGKKDGDYTCVCVLTGPPGPDQPLHVVDWVTVRGILPTQMGKLLTDLNDKHHFTKVGFEANAAQGVFLYLFQEQGVRLPFEPVVNSLPKKNRIDGLEPFVSTGKILFDPDWQQRNDGYALSMRQLLNYNGRDYGNYDDGPDGLAGAFAMAYIPRKQAGGHGRWA